MRITLPRHLWQHLPLWDELSAGIRLSSLFPLAEDGAVYSSRSRLLSLLPPVDYAPGPAAASGGRILGKSIDGRPLMLGYDVPLFAAGAPSSFLVQQALGDLQSGRTVVVVSPRRRVLEQIAQQAGEGPVFWLDPQNAKSAHLALVSAEEWDTVDMETVVETTQLFLADIGLGIDLPAVNDLTRRLLQALAEFARQTGKDLAFTDLYAIGQNTRALNTFLSVAPGEAASTLLARLDDETGYVQAVTILSAIRTALRPLRIGPFRAFCQAPFLNAGQVLRKRGVILVPMTNADFPEHDCLLSAMLDLTLNRVLAAGDDVNLALHLHDAYLYRDDEGRRWIEAARQDPRVSLLLDVDKPDRFAPRDGGQVVFRCSDTLASVLIDEWGLPASVSDLMELPPDTAIARLPGMVVTLKVSEK